MRRCRVIWAVGWVTKGCCVGVAPVELRLLTADHVSEVSSQLKGVLAQLKANNTACDRA